MSDDELPTPDQPAATGHAVLSEEHKAQLTPAQRTAAVVDQWWADAKATVGPQLTTEAYNALLATTDNLKAALAAALA